MTSAVSPSALKAMLRDGEELALLDVREEGVFARAHLLLAVPLALSQLELRVRALVPRRTTRIVLCDGGELGSGEHESSARDSGLAERAAAKLADWGYSNVAVLAGGTAGWAAAGYELFSGFNVPSKAFGEFVEHRYGTPSIGPEELNALLERGERMVILDSRPMAEYHRMNIPGGVNVPGGELVYRLAALAPDPETLVVVNCAGRTRSIIGAQSLINAGVPNKVVALRNGTMGWHLAGLTLERGKTRVAPAVGGQHLDTAREAAARVAGRFHVPTVDRVTLAQWQEEGQDQADQRSLYVLDVRHPHEYEAGHLPGARSAPGGQLVQATDQYIGTRGSRVVLVDDTTVRATMAASWLIQLGGYEVYVLDGGMLPYGLETGSGRVDIPGLGSSSAPEITPQELAAQSGRWCVLDLADSRSYVAGHIAGAWFAIRSRLAEDLQQVPHGGRLVLTSPDGTLAWLAAPEAQAAGVPEVRVLSGGTEAWRGAGLPLRKGAEHMASPPEDVFPKPYDRAAGVEQAMQDYLSWEVALVRQIEADGDADFRYFPPN